MTWAGLTHDVGGRSHGHNVIRNGLDDQGAGAHDGPGTDRTLWKHIGAKPNQTSFADNNVPPQVGPRTDVSMITDGVVMIHYTAGIQDRVAANAAPRIHDNACTDHGTRTDADMGGHYGLRMTGNGKAFLLAGKLLEQPVTNCVVTDADDDAIVADGGQRG